MKHVHTSCDICNSQEPTQSKMFQMIREFDDCDGRTYYKHLSESTIDICNECYSKILISGKYLTDYRVMGYGEIKINEQ